VQLRHARVVEVAGVAADLGQSGQLVPAIERGVLDALGHHRAAGLLEAHHQVAARLARGVGGQQQPFEQHELGGEIAAGGVGALDRCGQSLGRRRVDGVPGSYVAAVDVDLHQQLAQRGGDPFGIERVGGFDRVTDLGAGAQRHPGQPAQLRLQQPGHDLALGAELDLGELDAPGCVGPHPLQRLVGGRHQRLLHRAQGVVAGRAGAGPGRGE
jgi:hypothetical protein